MADTPAGDTDRMPTATRERRQRGRPTEYVPDIAEQAYRLALLGADRDQMADIVLVSPGTFQTWIDTHSELSEAIKRGRADADAYVAQALYHRAIGYRCMQQRPMVIKGKDGQQQIVIATFEESYPPSEAAAIFWLKNRRPDLWRDKQDIDMSINGKISRLDDDDRTARAVRALDQLVAGRTRELAMRSYQETVAGHAADKARLPQVINAMANEAPDTPAE